MGSCPLQSGWNRLKDMEKRLLWWEQWAKARHKCFWILGSHRFPVGTDKGPFLIVFWSCLITVLWPCMSGITADCIIAQSSVQLCRRLCSELLISSSELRWSTGEVEEDWKVMKSFLPESCAASISKCAGITFEIMAVPELRLSPVRLALTHPSLRGKA